VAIPITSFLSSLITPTSHAWSNIIDNALGEHFKENIFLLVSFTKVLILIITLPLIFYFAPTISLPLSLIGLLAINSIIDFAYMYPYFMALKHTDTSIVASLFSLGKIIFPIMATTFLKEHLQTVQYIGFFLIIFSSALLTFNPRKFRFNIAIFYMLLASILVSIHAILYKYILMQGVTWEMATFWYIVFGGIFGLLFIIKSPKKSLSLWRGGNSSTKKLLYLAAVSSLIGNAGFIFALSLLPASIVKAIESTQPLFISLYAKLFGKKYPHYFKENSTDIVPVIKYSSLLFIVIGTILTVI